MGPTMPSSAITGSSSATTALPSAASGNRPKHCGISGLSSIERSPGTTQIVELSLEGLDDVPSSPADCPIFPARLLDRQCYFCRIAGPLGYGPPPRGERIMD